MLPRSASSARCSALFGIEEAISATLIPPLALCDCQADGHAGRAA